MRNYKLKNTIFFFVLAGMLFNVSSFCHSFSMGGHSDMDQTIARPTSFSAEGEVKCCTGQNPVQIISSQILAARPANQILLMESMLGLTFLLVAVYGLVLLNPKNTSRYRYYHKRNLLSRLYNYILQFLSKGILQPQVYNA